MGRGEGGRGEGGSKTSASHFPQGSFFFSCRDLGLTFSLESEIGVNEDGTLS